MVTERWQCPRCGGYTLMDWPSGDPLVSLRVERVYHQQRPGPPFGDRTRTGEPAGVVVAMLCLACADDLWGRLREALVGC